MTTYNPKEIESKWQSFWRKEKTFSVKEDPNKKVLCVRYVSLSFW